jgi:spermidine synthase
MEDISSSDRQETAAFWFTEEITPTLKASAKLNSISFNGQSEFQKVQIIDTCDFGKTLVLDGKTQSALSDECIYHECLVHPTLLQHPCPKTVYIGGGGEFATAREVLKYKSVEKVIMVDIDKKVCDMCREQMPEWNAGVFDDPRLEVHYDDAHAFLKGYDGKFDVIIMDISDPIEAGPGYVLYTQEFYNYAVSKLNIGGIFVTQSGPGSLFNMKDCFTAIHNTLKQEFDCVVPYTVNIPSFACDWAFNMAFNTEAEDALTSVKERRSSDTNELIANRIPNANLKFYDGTTHLGLFGISKIIRDGLESDKRVITVDDPVFMF